MRTRAHRSTALIRSHSLLPTCARQAGKLEKGRKDLDKKADFVKALRALEKKKVLTYSETDDTIIYVRKA